MSIAGRPSTIKSINKELIEGHIRKHGPISKQDISKDCQLSLVTVNKIVDELVTDKKVRSFRESASTGGRRAQLFEIDPDFKKILIIFFQKNTFITTIADYAGEYQMPEIVAIQKRDPLETLVGIIAKEVKAVENLKQLSLGVPGIMQGDQLLNIPSIPSWEGLPLKKMLQEKFGLDVVIENDINAGALGIYSSEKRRLNNFSYIYLDQGAGSAAILNGQLIRGSSGFAGEIGNIPIDGERCVEDFMMAINDALSANQEISETTLQDFLAVVKAIVVSYVSILNPQLIVLEHVLLNESSMALLQTALETALGSVNLPELRHIDDSLKESIEGLIKIAIIDSSQNVRISNQGWK